VSPATARLAAAGRRRLGKECGVIDPVTALWLAALALLLALAAWAESDAED
jgi:hypothetical protein